MANTNYAYLSTSEVGSGNITVPQLVANSVTGRLTSAVRMQFLIIDLFIQEMTVAFLLFALQIIVV